ncbi:hypothetical protein SKAU_G00394760 [Synaphobranchus kaupii]|uniref:Uncharacterized protein n=1 Tax=Synaphobranchus kaupii TaxID=118154 RepID=A0A9Q1IBY3_SYNKA|nr:hypothetical protein SKAU_G00394760 [Synaphobranchus kaupii]
MLHCDKRAMSSMEMEGIEGRRGKLGPFIGASLLFGGPSPCVSAFSRHSISGGDLSTQKASVEGERAVVRLPRFGIKPRALGVINDRSLPSQNINPYFLHGDEMQLQPQPRRVPLCQGSLGRLPAGVRRSPRDELRAGRLQHQGPPLHR